MPNESEINELEIQPIKFRHFDAGTKLYTIRNGHRRYAKSLSISCGPHKLGGICNSFVHTLLYEVPFHVFEEEGFHNFEEVLETLRIFYPEIQLDSPVTIVEFRRAL